MKDKVLFMTKVQFMNHHVQDMYVKAISEKFVVELWDLSKIYCVKEESTLPDIVEVKSLDDLNSKLSKMKKLCNITVITNIQPRDLSLIYATLKQNDVTIVGIVKDTIAISLEKRGHMKYIKYYDAKTKILTVFPFLRKIVSRNRIKASKYDYLLAGANYYPSQTNHFLRIHQIKYDEYLHAKESTNIVGCKYILLLDSSPTTHPMYCHQSNSPSHEEYMKQMLSHIEKVEKDTGLKIVISVHPKGHYESKEWGGRKIYIGNTAELIHHSEGVICHWSTSLINAVLEYKPVQIVFYPKLLQSSFWYTAVTGLEFGRICKADITNILKPHKWTMKVDKESYDKFLSEEIINRAYKKMSNAELICSYLEKIMNRSI